MSLTPSRKSIVMMTGTGREHNMTGKARYYTVYQITNLRNGKIYIGMHETNNLNDDYFGSGKLILQAIKKHGKDVFKKEILHVFNTREEMIMKEKELVTESFINQKNTYNLREGGYGGGLEWFSLNAKGKTYEELYGEDRANTMKINMAKKATELGLANYMIEARSAGRKEWWSSLSTEVKTEIQRKKAQKYWDSITDDELKDLSQYRKVYMQSYWSSISTEEKKKRLDKTHEKIRNTYKITEPNGQVHTTQHLRKFRLRGLPSYNTLLLSVKENRTVKNGWRCELCQ